MTIRECYEAMGADFDSVLIRLCSEAMIQKFAMKFLDDHTFDQLTSAITEQRIDDAFRAAHTLKGVCVNLGFDSLSQVSSELTEMLRTGSFDGIDELYEKTAVEYRRTIDALSKFRQD